MASMGVRVFRSVVFKMSRTSSPPTSERLICPSSVFFPPPVRAAAPPSVSSLR